MLPTRQDVKYTQGTSDTDRSLKGRGETSNPLIHGSTMFKIRKLIPGALNEVGALNGNKENNKPLCIQWDKGPSWDADVFYPGRIWHDRKVGWLANNVFRLGLSSTTYGACTSFTAFFEAFTDNLR
jgi:hypothetical protein